jgi:hypothetical protein
MDIGRVMNAKTAASQVRGGVIMGIGQALMEECHFDPISVIPWFMTLPLIIFQLMLIFRALRWRLWVNLI